jgi:hypothetical protein
MRQHSKQKPDAVEKQWTVIHTAIWQFALFVALYAIIMSAMAGALHRPSNYVAGAVIERIQYGAS